MSTYTWHMAKELGYEPKTTFWKDFSIAEKFGGAAIRDTYERAFEEWKDNHVYLTELSMVLNHRLWKHYDNGRLDLAKIYDKLWRKTDDYAYANLKDEKLNYYTKTTN